MRVPGSGKVLELSTTLTEVGRATRRATSALGLQEKVLKQLTYTKNPRIPSSLSILPMALNTPLPRKEKSCKHQGLLHLCPVQLHTRSAATRHSSVTPAIAPALQCGSAALFLLLLLNS